MVHSSTLDNMDRRQMMIAFDMRIYDGKNGAAGTHGSINFNEVQIIPHEDTNCGAGWNLLSLLLATKPSKRISCLDALRHPFLCGPRLRVAPSLDIIRWGLGSTAVRITEEYIYKQPQVQKEHLERP
ncbi:hypothetical protein NC652_034375 [Populus alba x Populus x berolinensis]|nr:hypothetical protein NC652_034375 [Populus alba x Populus x berolinensis]